MKKCARSTAQSVLQRITQCLLRANILYDRHWNSNEPLHPPTCCNVCSYVYVPATCCNLMSGSTDHVCNVSLDNDLATLDAEVNYQ